MDIKDIITKSSDNVRSAIEIQKNVDLCKIDLMKRLLKTIEEKVNYPRLYLYSDYEYDFDNYIQLRTYYKKQTWPAINYLYRTDSKFNIDIWVRIEIDHIIFIGFCITNDGKKFPLKKDIKKQISNNVGDNIRDSWWINYEYIIETTTNEVPNFKEMNEAAIQLFDKDNFNKFVDICANKIEELLKSDY